MNTEPCDCKITDEGENGVIWKQTIIYCPLHAAAPELLEALKEMAEWHGASHDLDCPSDDTCNCSRKPFNDRVNKVIIKAEPWRGRR